MAMASGATALGAKASFASPSSLVNTISSSHGLHSSAAVAIPHASKRTNTFGPVSGSLSSTLSLESSPSSSFAGHKVQHSQKGANPKQKGKGHGGALATSAAFGNVLGGLFGGNKGDDGSGTAKKYAADVAKINALEPEMQALSDEGLQERTTDLQKRVRGGASLDSVLHEAFAVVREGSRRVLGLRPFDVQLIGELLHPCKRSGLNTSSTEILSAAAGGQGGAKMFAGFFIA